MAGRKEIIRIVRRRVSALILALLCAGMLRAAPSAALTAQEQHTVSLCTNVGRGVVNVTSKAMTQDALVAPLPSKGSGSGFVLDYLGHILTNAHLISDPYSIEVTFQNGRKWPARLLGTDPDTDLAVLEVMAPAKEIEGLTGLPLGTTTGLDPGQQALAFGNPFGSGPIVACGVISASQRSVATPEGRIVDSVLQTDIPVDGGLSGGPLVDSSGRVIGINTMIFNPPAQCIGMGFAIAAETVQRVASQLISKGYVSYPWLGAKLQTLTAHLAGVLGLSATAGALVTEVIPDGPAAKAGLRGATKELRLGNRIYPVGGDLIVAVDGVEVDSDAALIRALQTKEPGEDVLISCYRDDRLRRFKVRLGHRPGAGKR